ncbi:MAG: helix-turn-helix domain-containing protein [Chloroflexi bacterium]|nr:helix-turn-helix domain-containing protein [Chloroflexota bacterium]
MVSPAFGRLLRDLRVARGVSQRGLARAAGVTPAYVSLIEQGRRGPEPAVVRALAGALALSAAETASLLHAAGYVSTASTTQPDVKQSDGAIGSLRAVLDDPALTDQQRASIESLVLIYATGLAARAKDGRPLVSDLAAPWQARVLETLQEKMAEDFEQFHDAYVNRVFEL